MKSDRRTFLAGASLATLLPSVHLAPAVSAAVPSGKIRAGQIGTRHAHASGKVGTMRKFSDQYDVVGVVEADKKRRAELANQSAYQGVTWMSEDQLLNTPGLELVCVETEVKDLLDTAARCIDANMHIHLDKPAGESYPKFQALVKAASERQRIIQMGYMFRYNPGFRFIFQAIKQGWLGEIFEAHTVISKTVGDNTRDQLAEYPGGTMFELGCHVIDSLIHAIGVPDKVTPFPRQTRPDRDDLKDNQLAVFEYPRATATVRSALVEVDGGRRRQLVVCGNQGTIALRPLEPPLLSLTLDRDRGDFKKGTQQVSLPRLGGRYDGDFRDLAAVLRGKREFEFSYQHDLAVQKAVLLASGLSLE